MALPFRCLIAYCASVDDLTAVIFTALARAIRVVLFMMRNMKLCGGCVTIIHPEQDQDAEIMCSCQWLSDG